MAQTVYDPPVATYIPLQTITLGSAASSVTFASIPQTYRDLVLVVSGGVSAPSTVSVEIYPNGDSSNGSLVWMQGNGSSASSSTSSRIFFVLAANNSSSIIQFMDYSATDKHKTMLIRDNNPDDVRGGAARWASTTAISSLTLTDASGQTFDAGTVFSIYGIAS